MATITAFSPFRELIRLTLVYFIMHGTSKRNGAGRSPTDRESWLTGREAPRTTGRVGRTQPLAPGPDRPHVSKHAPGPGQGE